MVRIAPSTGSRRRIRPRMARSRARSGRPVRNTSATGAITARKVSEFSFTRTVISTKACGQSISATDRVLTGRMKELSLDVSTLVTGMRTRSTEEVLSSTRMVIATMVTGSMDYLRAKVV